MTDIIWFYNYFLWYRQTQLVVLQCSLCCWSNALIHQTCISGDHLRENAKVCQDGQSMLHQAFKTRLQRRAQKGTMWKRPNAWSWEEKDGSLVHPDKTVFIHFSFEQIVTSWNGLPGPRDPWRDRTIPDLATSLPRQQGSWHHLFTSAHLPQFALASSVSGYSQKVADLLESMAEPLGRLQGREHWWHQCCATTKLERYRLRSVKSRWKQILSTEVVVQYADECSWSCNLWNQKKYT